MKWLTNLRIVKILYSDIFLLIFTIVSTEYLQNVFADPSSIILTEQITIGNGQYGNTNI